MEQRILVALSGGIDSAAAVLMLREQGYAVTGLYIDMLGSMEQRNMAADVAKRLGIDLIIENVAVEFRTKIIEYTLAEHRAGRTPSPCAVCNPVIKWAVTERVADRIGIYWIATGHYVRTIGGAVYKGVDPAKDQSYYLWGLAPETLNRALTPLGEYTKIEVREYLRRHDGFDDLATGGESMSICFLGGTTYSDFLRQNLTISPGETVDQSGQVVGTHDGYQLYTVGQKKGFTGGGALLSVDVEHNRIITTKHPESLYTDHLNVRNCIVHTSQTLVGLSVKVRGIGRNPQGVISHVESLGSNTWLITLNQADAWAVAEGQPIVFYDGDRVVGGAIVVSDKNRGDL